MWLGREQCFVIIFYCKKLLPPNLPLFYWNSAALLSLICPVHTGKLCFTSLIFIFLHWSCSQQESFLKSRQTFGLIPTFLPVLGVETMVPFQHANSPLSVQSKNWPVFLLRATKVMCAWCKCMRSFKLAHLQFVSFHHSWTSQVRMHAQCQVGAFAICELHHSSFDVKILDVLNQSDDSIRTLARKL